MKFFLRIYAWRVLGKDHGMGWWTDRSSVYVPMFSWSLALGFAPPVFGPWFMFVKGDTDDKV